MRYKAKNVDALHIALGGMPNKVRVEVESGIEVSAKTGKNLELLLELILLVADLQSLKADPTLPAMGAVLEAKIDRGRGNVATVLVQNGTLRVGDNFVAGAVYGKVRAMFD